MRWFASLLVLISLLSLAPPARASPELVYRGNGTCRDIALTYDVEFSAATQHLADTLDELGIRTTWFFVGDSVARHSALVRRVAARHQIGNHSYSHPDFGTLTQTGMQSQLALAEANIRQVAGISPEPFWRPPYGSHNAQARAVAEAEGYPFTVLWTIDPADWTGVSAESIHRSIVANAFPGAIAVMHGFPTETAAGSALAVRELRARGYQFVTISEILGIDRHLRDFGGDTYVVQAGDSLDWVGACHNLTGPRLAAYNDLTAPAPGTKLQIPHTSEIIIRLNGERQPYPVYPRIREGRATVHVRMAEQLGANVAWTGDRVVITSGSRTIEITPGKQEALADGAPVDMGTAAYVVNQRVLVPVRFIAEQLGATVGWEQASYTVLITQ